MTNLTLKSAIGLLVTVLALSGCKKDPGEPIASVPPTDYDANLLAAIEAVGGTSEFTMPMSTDYASIPQDPTNPMNTAKVQLGKLLFHETAIATGAKLEDPGTETYACASCHHAWGGFQANKQQGIGEGGSGFGFAGEGREFSSVYPLDSIDLQPLRTPTAMNGAYQEAMLWNGQFGAQGVNEGTEDLWPMGTPIWNNHFGHAGLEIQAIAGLTVHRLVLDEQFCQDYALYEDLFDLAFPDWPEETRYTERTAGLAIAAYERTLLSNQAPFQLWLQGDYNAMTDQQKRGAELFFGKANCVACHSGPALNSMTFYAYGMNDMEGNGTYGASSDNTVNLGRGSFTQDPADDYKFKTPQLYNMKDSPFMGHGGTFTNIRDVVAYKNDGVAENLNVPQDQLAAEFVALGLTEAEIDDLTAFLENGLYDPNLLRYVPSDLPSGNCIPNNDPISQIDQGCVQ